MGEGMRPQDQSARHNNSEAFWAQESKTQEIRVGNLEKTKSANVIIHVQVASESIEQSIQLQSTNRMQAPIKVRQCFRDTIQGKLADQEKMNRKASRYWVLGQKKWKGGP